MIYYHINYKDEIELYFDEVFIDNDAYNNPQTYCEKNQLNWMDIKHNTWKKVYDCGGPEAYEPVFVSEKEAAEYQISFKKYMIECDKKHIKKIEEQIIEINKKYLSII